MGIVENEAVEFAPSPEDGALSEQVSAVLNQRATASFLLDLKESQNSYSFGLKQRSSSSSQSANRYLTRSDLDLVNVAQLFAHEMYRTLTKQGHLSLLRPFQIHQ